MTSTHGLVLCTGCDRVWYSAAFLHPDAVDGAACQECGCALEAVPERPFGEGALRLPADWGAAQPQS